MPALARSIPTTRYENGSTGSTSYALQAQSGTSDRIVGYQYWGTSVNATCLTGAPAWPYAGKWSHVALVYDLGSERLVRYVDGVVRDVCGRPTSIGFTPTTTTRAR